MSGPGLARMVDRTPAGLCPFCLDPLAQKLGKKRSGTCGDPECRKAWMRTYMRDYRQGLKVRDQLVTGPNGGRRR